MESNRIVVRSVIIDDKQSEIDLIKKHIDYVNTKDTGYYIKVVSTTLEHKSKNKHLTGFDAPSIDLIETEKPELVFQDIQMDLTTSGYDILTHFIENRTFSVLLMTRFEHLVMCSFDDELIGTFDKGSTQNQFLNFCKSYFYNKREKNEEESLTEYLNVYYLSKNVKIPIANIQYIEVKGDYCCIHFLRLEDGYRNGNKIIKRIPETAWEENSLVNYEKRLPTFLRAGRYVLINKNFLDIQYCQEHTHKDNTIRLFEISETLTLSEKGKVQLLNAITDIQIKKSTLFQKVFNKFYHHA